MARLIADQQVGTRLQVQREFSAGAWLEFETSNRDLLSVKVDRKRRIPVTVLLRAIDGVTAVDADLEAGAWPFAGRRFDGIVVTHYLWRPLFPHLVAALAEGGVLIYETFGIGNESFGKPSNPQFLLRTGELLEVARGAGLATVAFETGFTVLPKPAVIERICARAPGAGSTPANLDGPGAGPGA